MILADIVLACRTGEHDPFNWDLLGKPLEMLLLDVVKRELV